MPARVIGNSRATKGPLERAFGSGALLLGVALALVASALAKIDGDTTPSVRVVEGHDAGKELRLDADGRVDIHLLDVPAELAAEARLGAQVCPHLAITIIEPTPRSAT